MKSMPMPPYSGGRWGAHSPSAFTFSWISSRSALASARSASVTLLPRACQSSDSLGRIFSLTMRAVRSRMSLMSSLSPGMGVTLMGMGRSPVGLCLFRLEPYADSVARFAPATQRPVRARS